jgi:hypothetical protein
MAAPNPQGRFAEIASRVHDLNGSTKVIHWVDGAPADLKLDLKTPLGSALRDCREAKSATRAVVEAVNGFRQEVADNPRLSHAGRVEQLKERRKLAEQRLDAVQNAIANVGWVISETEKALVAVEPREPGDLAGASLDAEARALIRSWPDAERALRLEKRSDPSLLDAALRAAPELSGLTQQQWERLRDARIEAKYPLRLAELRGVSRSLYAARRAIASAREGVAFITNAAG